MNPLRRRDIPNALTLLRLGLAGATIAILSAWPGPEAGAEPGAGSGFDLSLLLAAALFVLAAATDALDGYLARKWSAVSIFGRIMDPFADKLLVLGTLIALAGGAFAAPGAGGAAGAQVTGQISGFAPWMVVLILARELLVTSIRGAYESRGIDFSASWAGKLKMMLQSGAIPVILLIIAAKSGRPEGASLSTIQILAWATTLVTIWSALPYITRAIAVGRSGGVGGARGVDGPTSAEGRGPA